jgi:poly(3-hydroxybutyrate) depolymerase
MWTTLEIAGKPADVYDPPEVERPRFGLLYLHGITGESLASSPGYTRWLKQYRLACVCPRGGRCWWGDRPCPEFDPAVTPERYLLDRVVPFCHERWGLAPRRLGLFGVSMGGQGALRLAFKHPRTFPAVAGIASALDVQERYGEGTPLDAMYDSKEHCRQDTAILHLHPVHYPPHIFFCVDPDDEPWYRGNDRLHEKMTALGVPHTAELTARAGGHSWEYAARMAERVVGFLADGLEQESLRLL